MHVQAHHAQTSPFQALQNSSQGPMGRSTAAAASSSNSSSTPSAPTSTSTATITANDFLQLLVTELQNQDPTADTDPNEYVDQLVQVNSLQQQIQMNETMDGGPTLTGSSSGLLQELMQLNSTVDGSTSSGSSGGSGGVTRSAAAAHHHAAAGGNLGLPADTKTQAAAEKVASALAPHAGPGVGTGSTMQAFEEFAANIKNGAQHR